MLEKIKNSLLIFFKEVYWDIRAANPRITIFIIGLAIITVVFCFLMMRNNTNTDVNTNNKTTKYEKIVTKEAFDDMVQQAADGKYIKTVLTDSKPTPLPLQASSKKPIPLQPYPADLSNDNAVPINIAQKQEVASADMQRCSYKDQIYVPGDIVKTDQGWIRCVPTFSFSQDGTKQASSAAWTIVQ